MQYYKATLGHKMTVGVKELCDEQQSYWLVDAIISYQLYATVKKEAFQAWKLKRIKDDRFSLTCDDGNGNILITQKIPFSDFKEDSCTIWLCDKVLLLPSEY
jgi:hypothetical protein